MIRIEMPIKDYSFVKHQFTNMERYLIHVVYSREKVLFEIPEEKYPDFLLDYRSTIMRKGTIGKEAYNDIGLRLTDIFNTYINIDEAD